MAIEHWPIKLLAKYRLPTTITEYWPTEYRLPTTAYRLPTVSSIKIDIVVTIPHNPARCPGNYYLRTFR